MTILNGYTNVAPHQRQNRRRGRPGSRTRVNLSRKCFTQTNLLSNYEQDILDARDTSIALTSDKTKPSPLLRQNFDQSWQRWKAREAEEAAAVEDAKARLERERMALFGGEVDDDVSLCEPMLRVLMSLFGDIDYTDP